MAYIRHIAIASKDPAATADFYKKHFDMKELFRQPKDTGDDGVWLSDGYIYFAILKPWAEYAEAWTGPVVGLLRHPSYRLHG